MLVSVTTAQNQTAGSLQNSMVPGGQEKSGNLVTKTCVFLFVGILTKTCEWLITTLPKAMV